MARGPVGPAALRPGDGLPFGVTLFAPAHSDATLLRLAARLQRHLRPGPRGAPIPPPQRTGVHRGVQRLVRR